MTDLPGMWEESDLINGEADMTDTQEAMRAEFEAATTVPYGVAFIQGRYRAKEGSGGGHWVTANAYHHDYEIWQAATAQSAEKIARLEEDIAQMTRAYTDSADEYEQQLASAELSNKQLLIALESLRHIVRTIADRQYPALNLVTQQALGILDLYLAQPISTETLDAYVNEEIKRRQDAAKKFSDCLPQFKGDTMHPPTSELAPINQDEPYHEQR